jgi:threonine/homoserine/homoserine lactone efflux protein
VLSQVPEWFQNSLYIAGGLFVLYLAYGAYKSWKNFDANTPNPELSTQQSVLKAAFVNVLSPGPYIFWTVVTGPILLTGWRETPIFGITFILGFYTTFILFLMLIILVFGTMRNLGGKIQRALIGISALALFCFGLYQVWQGLN